MNKLRDIIENNTSFRGKVFDYFIQSLIILSLIALSIETLPNLSNENLNILSGEDLRGDTNLNNFSANSK